MKILLPVDGSAHTKRMLGYVAAHDELFGPRHEYVALHAVPAIPVYAARFLDRGVLDEHYRDEARRVLDTVEAFARQQGWTLRTEHAVGPAAEAIAGFANAEKPDLIVMGTHGHSALGNVLLGSVATGVLARCRVPVLFVH
jgi:nucleotide-binding universal stress UspA family protein